VAKKARTPTPPRRPVQAPKPRTGKQPRRGSAGPAAGAGGRPTWLYALAALGPLALLAVVVFLVVGRDTSSPNDAGLAKTMAAAGCTLRTSAGQFAKPDHSTVPTLSTPVKWHTYPPANGPHYGIRAVWNFYDQPVNPRQALHNAEHGGVIIWYGPKISAATREQLRSFYEESPDAMLATPLVGYGKKIAITAWTGNPQTYFRKVNGKVDYGTGHIAVCQSFNKKAFTAFRDTYRAKGPEPDPTTGGHIPASTNAPGT
jgi:Protein of unknown function (DUF3105)